MNKYEFEELEKIVSTELKRVEPIVGHWYKVSYMESKSQSKSIRNIMKLCIGIADYEGPNISLMGVDTTVNALNKIRIFPFELHYAEWPQTNRFHRFCLAMIHNLLGEKTTQIDIFADHRLYVLMETVLLQKIIEAKTDKEAIEEAKEAAKKGFGARLNKHPYGYFNPDKTVGGGKQKAEEAFQWLLDEYALTKR